MRGWFEFLRKVEWQIVNSYLTDFDVAFLCLKWYFKIGIGSSCLKISNFRSPSFQERISVLYVVYVLDSFLTEINWWNEIDLQWFWQKGMFSVWNFWIQNLNRKKKLALQCYLSQAESASRTNNETLFLSRYSSKTIERLWNLLEQTITKEKNQLQGCSKLIEYLLQGLAKGSPKIFIKIMKSKKLISNFAWKQSMIAKFLKLAVQGNQPKVFKFLKTSPVYSRFAVTDADTQRDLFSIAIAEGNITMARKLQEQAQGWCQTLSPWKIDPLVTASTSNQLGSVKYLHTILRWSNKNSGAEMALKVALENGYFAIIEYLVEEMAMKLDQKETTTHLLFQHIVANGFLGLLLFTKEKMKWNLIWANKQTQRKAFETACRNGFLDVAQFLQKENQLRASDFQTMTLVEDICCTGDLEIFKYLYIEWKLTVDDIRENSYLPLFNCVVNNHTKLITFIFENFPGLIFLLQKEQDDLKHRNFKFSEDMAQIWIKNIGRLPSLQRKYGL
jgi:hypothetical protein